MNKVEEERREDAQTVAMYGCAERQRDQIKRRI